MYDRYKALGGGNKIASTDLVVCSKKETVHCGHAHENGDGRLLLRARPQGGRTELGHELHCRTYGKHTRIPAKARC